jgi:hypothetical protein
MTDIAKRIERLRERGRAMRILAERRRAYRDARIAILDIAAFYEETAAYVERTARSRPELEPRQ